MDDKMLIDAYVSGGMNIHEATRKVRIMVKRAKEAEEAEKLALKALEKKDE